MSLAAQQYPFGRPTVDAAEAGLSMSFPAVPESLRPIRDVVAGFAAEADSAAEADISDQALDAIRLVCSEAAANVVRHAYPTGTGQIHLRAVRDSGVLWIVIADDGRGLSVGPGRPGAGIGFALMARFSHAMTLEPAPAGGLELSFRFQLRDRQPSREPV